MSQPEKLSDALVLDARVRLVAADSQGKPREMSDRSLSPDVERISSRCTTTGSSARWLRFPENRVI
jgi:hypothetical protein